MLTSASVSPETLEALRRIPTPAAANAIEEFNLRPRNEGFMSHEIRSIFPDLGIMVGFACTARIAADQPAEETASIPREVYWKHVESIPGPKVAVVQDIDNPPCVGAFWGEVNANIHRALGCVGTVTNGGVRDLDEVRELGFHMYAKAPIVSHAYIHLVDCGKPVKVGGMIVRPGDLIHADQHGVHVIPLEIADELPAVVEEIERKERRIIDLCRSPEFSIEKLRSLYS